MDINKVLYAPIYKSFGVDAVIRSAFFDEFTIRAIDLTSGVEVSGSSDVRKTGVGVMTILPIASIIMADLTALGLTRENLEGAVLDLNSKLWRIKSTMLKPSLYGEAAGELYLHLEEEEDLQ